MTEEELKRLEAMIAAVKSEGDDQPWSDLYEQAWDALPAALAEIRRLRGLIKQVEKTSDDDGWLIRCPWCAELATMNPMATYHAPETYVAHHRADCPAFTPAGEVK